MNRMSLEEMVGEIEAAIEAHDVARSAEDYMYFSQRMAEARRSMELLKEALLEVMEG